jgi:FkbM family methyltransferase
MNFRGIIDRCYIKQPRLREITTLFLYGRTNCEVEVAGLKLTINRLRENGYLRASLKAKGSSLLSHEIHVATVIALLANRANTFIDAGANIGFFSCMMAKRRKLAPDFKVMAFEPHPDTYQRLQQNGQRYGIETFNLALSDRNTRKTFVDGAVSHVFTAIGHANAYNIRSREIAIDCRRLDEMVPPERSCFIKIDTEGQELEVLIGAEGLFKAARVAGVYIDGHDQTRVPEFLRRHGFALYDVATLDPTDGSAYGLLALRADGL